MVEDGLHTAAVAHIVGTAAAAAAAADTPGDAGSGNQDIAAEVVLERQLQDI